MGSARSVFNLAAPDEAAPDERKECRALYSTNPDHLIPSKPSPTNAGRVGGRQHREAQVRWDDEAMATYDKADLQRVSPGVRRSARSQRTGKQRGAWAIRGGTTCRPCLTELVRRHETSNGAFRGADDRLMPTARATPSPPPVPTSPRVASEPTGSTKPSLAASRNCAKRNNNWSKRRRRVPSSNTTRRGSAPRSPTPAHLTDTGHLYSWFRPAMTPTGNTLGSAGGGADSRSNS